MSHALFHPGELAAQGRFNADWNPDRSQGLERLIGNALDERMMRFVASRHSFFLATADADGRCDCSFKGSENDAEGRRLPAVWVTAPGRLLFPDYGATVSSTPSAICCAIPSWG